MSDSDPDGFFKTYYEKVDYLLSFVKQSRTLKKKLYDAYVNMKSLKECSEN